MHVVSFLTQKGGAGKSMLAINLAGAAQSAGQRVVLIDLDPQNSVCHWDSLREATEPAVIGADDAYPLPDTLARLDQAGFDLCFVDTPGADSPVARDVAKVSKVCIVPVRPTEADLHAMKPTVKTLQALARQHIVVLNQAPPNASARLSQQARLRVAASSTAARCITSRMDFQYAYALGQTVIEYAPESKASIEILELWNELVRRYCNDANEKT